MKALGVKEVQLSVWYGAPAPAIIDATAFNHVDLIVMMSHGRSGLGRLVMGSVAESVLRGRRRRSCCFVSPAHRWRRRRDCRGDDDMLRLTRRAIDGLDVAAIRRQLIGEVIGTHVYIFADVGSTNAALRDAGGGGVAREETHGPPPVATWIAVRRSGPRRCRSLVVRWLTRALGIPAGVKWPKSRDRWERSPRGRRDRRERQRPPHGAGGGLGAAAADATSLREALGRPIDRNALAASFLKLLEKWLGRYARVRKWFSTPGRANVLTGIASSWTTGGRPSPDALRRARPRVPAGRR